MKKIAELKIAILLLVALFIAQVVLGQIYAVEVLTISGLICFTLGAALMTYYMVLTQP
ncbi:MAG TPA: hypothetical protein VLH35_01245 [Candidatus Acidoferrales bacterium]|nr:hypothetical protein [Candidatus Acidoferrales bacterium]